MITGGNTAVIVTVLVAPAVLVLASVANLTSRIAAWWPARWQTLSPRARRARMVAQFDRALQDQGPNRQLVRVVQVYQRGRRGTKCHIEHPFGRRQEAWFWRFTPRRGDVYLVRCSSRWGPHRAIRRTHDARHLLDRWASEWMHPASPTTSGPQPTVYRDASDGCLRIRVYL